jgi:hypothetical protein
MEVDLLEIVLFFLTCALPFIGGWGMQCGSRAHCTAGHIIESWRQYFECGDEDDERCAQLNIPWSEN